MKQTDDERLVEQLLTWAGANNLDVTLWRREDGKYFAYLFDGCAGKGESVTEAVCDLAHSISGKDVCVERTAGISERIQVPVWDAEGAPVFDAPEQGQHWCGADMADANGDRSVRMALIQIECGNEVEDAIAEECVDLARFLIAKNRAYGNSAFDPIRIFSKADAREQILVRLDDKISRMARGQAAGEDTPRDAQGYLTLWRVLDRLEAARGQSS